MVWVRELRTFLSVAKEKYQKNRHVREGASLTQPTVERTTPRPQRGVGVYLRIRSRTPDTPHERRSAVRAELSRGAELSGSFCHTSPRMGLTRELGAPPRLRTYGYP